MERKIKILLIILVVLAGCKTTKQVEKLDASFVEKVQTEQKTESEATENSNIKSKTGERLTKTNNTVIKETETHFSAPDSAGNQHVESVVNREITSGEVSEENKNTETEQSSDKTNSQVDTKSENKQGGSKLESESETTNKKIPAWPFWTALTVAVAFLFFWRFGGFGWLNRGIGRLSRYRSI